MPSGGITSRIGGASRKVETEQYTLLTDAQLDGIEEDARAVNTGEYWSTQSSTGWSSSGCRRSKGADGAPTRSVANESAADRGRDSVGVLVPEAGSTRRGAGGVGASRRN